MPKFNVPLKRTRTDYAWVAVEAKTAKAAQRKALQVARDDDDVEDAIDWCDGTTGRIATNGKPEEEVQDDG